MKTSPVSPLPPLTNFPQPAVDASPRDTSTPPQPVLARVARTNDDGTTYVTDVRPGFSQFPLSAATFGSFTGALDSARGAAKTFHDANVTGWFFRHHQPLVEAVAVQHVTDGWQLLPTSSQLDEYDRREGYIFKQWSHDPGATLAQKTDATIDGLVSYKRFVDFRQAAVGDVVPVASR